MALDNKPKRRFLPIGTEPVYDENYDRLKITSYIFNSDIRNRHVKLAGDVVNDTGRIQREILQLQGITDPKSNNVGKYLGSRDEIREAVIPSLEKQKAEIEQEFALYQQKQINTGNQKPEKMPPDLHEKYMICLASLDISTLELAVLKDNLNKAIERRTGLRPGERPKFRIGQHGGRLEDGILAEIDGQVCKPDSEGVIRICDENSPYDGILAWQYKRLQIENLKMNEKFRRLLNKEFDKREILGIKRPVKPSLPNPPFNGSLPNWIKEIYSWKEEKLIPVKGTDWNWDELIKNRIQAIMQKYG